MNPEKIYVVSQILWDEMYLLIPPEYREEIKKIFTEEVYGKKTKKS